MDHLLAMLGVTDLDANPREILGVLDAFSSHVAILDERGRILATNARWREFYESNGGAPDTCGVGADYLAACRLAARAQSPGAQDVAAALEEILAGVRREFSIEYPCHSPQEPRWFIARMAEFALAGRRRVLVTHEDVTPRKAAQQAAELLALVASRTANGVIITDAEQRIEWVNASFTAMTGYSREEVVGRRPGSFLQGDASDGPALDRVRRACAEGRPVTSTLLNYRKDGEPFFVELRIDPVRGPDGALLHFVAIQSDVTAAREREDAVAEAAQAERERLAADLHDGLGQELTGAALVLAALLQSADGPHAETLRRVLATVDRARETAREIAHGMAPTHVARGLLPSLRQLASSLTLPGHLQVTLATPPELELPGAYAHHLFCIAREAVANAIRHGQAREIAIDLERSAKSLQLTVSSDGHPFVGGDGMGLRVMRQRAHELRGEVVVTAGPQGGTVVICTAPLQAADVLPRAAASPARRG